jgi:hypothetical protein
MESPMGKLQVYHPAARLVDLEVLAGCVAIVLCLRPPVGLKMR